MRARVKITPARKARRDAEREKWGTPDKAQACDRSRFKADRFWSVKFVLPFKSIKQLSASNGFPSLIELSLLSSLVDCEGCLLQVKENPDTNFVLGCFAWRAGAFWEMLTDFHGRANQSPALLEQRISAKAWAFSVVPHFSLSLPRARLSRVGWFSRALVFRSLHYPWGKMGTVSFSFLKWGISF